MHVCIMRICICVYMCVYMYMCIYVCFTHGEHISDCIAVGTVSVSSTHSHTTGDETEFTRCGSSRRDWDRHGKSVQHGHTVIL